MNNLKHSFAGFGMMGAAGPYGMGAGTFFGWADWVTLALLWALILVGIIAIVKYISKD